ncbi:MAG: glycosyltransferase family 2 protein [Marinilabiliaceae bacterium]|nr:glycosyltransferase family 2 protein [Marinilabiliaceae bacterium]
MSNSFRSYCVSASIVLYRTIPDELRTCLGSLLSNGIDKVFVIDNSETNQLCSICPKDERVEYIFNNRNVGYGAAHNIAIRKSLAGGYKYHIVANPDIYFGSDVISKIVSYMNENYDVGQLIPNTLYPDGRLQYVVRLLPRPMDLFYRRFLPSCCTRKINYKFLLEFADHTKEMNVPFHQGSFMFFRSSALAEVGLFDERIFMYLEDVDLTRRMHKRFRTMFWPYVTIVHSHRSGSYKDFRLMLIHIISAIKYFNKWGWFRDRERELWNREIVEKYRKR